MKHHLTPNAESCLYLRNFLISRIMGIPDTGQRFMRKNIPKIIHVILTALLLMVFSIFPVFDIRAGETRLTIIHGSNLNGHLVPCPT